MNHRGSLVDQPLCHAAPDHGLEQLLQQIAVREAAMPILGERRVVRHLAIEPEPAETAVVEVQVNLLARSSAEIARCHQPGSRLLKQTSAPAKKVLASGVRLLGKSGKVAAQNGAMFQSSVRRRPPWQHNRPGVGGRSPLHRPPPMLTRSQALRCNRIKAYHCERLTPA